MPAGVYMFGANEIWRSVDSGATFQHYTTVTNEHWRNNSTDDFFEQTGTPFLAKSGHLIHVPRIGINPKWFVPPNFLKNQILSPQKRLK